MAAITFGSLFASAAASGGTAAAAGKGTALLVSAGVSAFGALAQGFAQRQAAAFNAATLRQQAERARQIAERDADAFARRQNRVRASARARRAGSGITSEGTPLLVDDAALDEALLGEATIRVGGQTRATRLEQQAVLSRLRGGAARTTGALRAGSTLLTGFGEAFDS